MESKRKFSKLAITSFVLICMVILIIAVGMLRVNVGIYILYLLFYFVPLATVAALIFSIISLNQIQKHNIRGKVLAIISIILILVAVIMAILFISSLDLHY
jgi:hypothetical protein